MTKPDSTPPAFAQALVSAIATLTLLLLFFGLFLPVVTFRGDTGGWANERVLTLWAHGVDHAVNADGGAATVFRALLLLIVLLAALVSMWSAALMYGGDIGHVGTTVARVSSLVLLVGAGVMAFQAWDLIHLARSWHGNPHSAVEPGVGAWWLLAGAVVFSAATLPESVRSLWSAGRAAQVTRSSRSR